MGHSWGEARLQINMAMLANLATFLVVRGRHSMEGNFGRIRLRLISLLRVEERPHPVAAGRFAGSAAKFAECAAESLLGNVFVARCRQ